jgi:hypothetical protein
MDLKEWREGVDWIQLAEVNFQYRRVLDTGPHPFGQTRLRSPYKINFLCELCLLLKVGYLFYTCVCGTSVRYLTEGCRRKC